MKAWAAAIQMASASDVKANLERAAALAREAAAAGAQLIGLPENFAYLGDDVDHKLAIAERLDVDKGGADGPILGAMRALARETKAWLILGGFPEKLPRDPEQPERIANTCVLLDAKGRVQARYRKLHLFDVTIPGGVRFRESDTVAPGDAPVLASTPWGGLGLSVCYDLRFPELYRVLTARGAVMLTVPSAFTRETGKDHWHALLRARAIENQAFVIAPAQFGPPGAKRPRYGHALIADPWGAVLAECGDREGFALAELDFDYQAKVRRDLPCLAHRKL